MLLVTTRRHGIALPARCSLRAGDPELKRIRLRLVVGVWHGHSEFRCDAHVFVVQQR
jgi:hypothetical protein